MITLYNWIINVVVTLLNFDGTLQTARENYTMSKQETYIKNIRPLTLSYSSIQGNINVSFELANAFRDYLEIQVAKHFKSSILEKLPENGFHKSTGDFSEQLPGLHF